MALRVLDLLEDETQRHLYLSWAADGFFGDAEAAGAVIEAAVGRWRTR